MNRILNDKGFRTHLIIYAAVNGGLALINAVSTPTHVWFQWPLIGWGIGLLGHAFLISQAPNRPPVIDLAEKSAMSNRAPEP